VTAHTPRRRTPKAVVSVAAETFYRQSAIEADRATHQKRWNSLCHKRKNKKNEWPAFSRHWNVMIS
jgi:hypothetical protein